VIKTLLLVLLLMQPLFAHAGEVTVFKLDKGLSSSIFKPMTSPKLKSAIAFIYDVNGESSLYEKNPDKSAPIASITKLMTAMVVLDAALPLDEKIKITKADIDRLKKTRSRLRVGTSYTRRELLNLALMSSENRAASALARTYPGGTKWALVAMNAKARLLDMSDTRFRDPTGLSSKNVSTARDLVKMVLAAKSYPLIHQDTTTVSSEVIGKGGRKLRYKNTNPLVKKASWTIGVSKTGYINEAGRCLVMEATIDNRPVVIVLLNSWGTLTRIGDANRVKKWMERANLPSIVSASVKKFPT